MSNVAEYADECLHEHNQLRAKHHAPPLKHSHALDKTAEEWANYLLQKENIVNSPMSSRGELGESISKRTSTSSFVDISAIDAVRQWYNDIRNYDFETGKGPAGNFTQMVWAGTREVGFGKARAPGQCVFVTHYRPPGNVRGKYLKNVFPKGSPDLQCSRTAQAFPAANIADQTEIDPTLVTKRTVVTHSRMDPSGRESVVRRETIEFKGSDGSLRHRVNETCIDADGVDAAKQSDHDSASLSDDSDCKIGRALTPPSHDVHGKQQRALRTFVKDVVRSHNLHRTHHGVQSLTYNKRLSMMAQDWAEYLADEICLSNSGFTYEGLRLGENISSRWSNTMLNETGQDVVDSWYQECNKFRYGKQPEGLQGIGNFAQLVWASSRLLGVGKATRVITAEALSGGDSLLVSAHSHTDCVTNELPASLSVKTVVVCFYFPPGNVVGMFIENVKPPKGDTVGSASEKDLAT